jgi:predicted nucleic acid-binding Zn ribbon protein
VSTSGADGAPRCPRCGAALSPGQDWCTQCGTAATTRILRARGWRIPIAVVIALLALGGGAVAAAFVAVTDDARNVDFTTNRKTLTITGTTPATSRASPPPTGATTGTTPGTPTGTSTTGGTTLPTVPNTTSTPVTPAPTTTSRGGTTSGGTTTSRPEEGALNP